ncbi:MAG: hypothetical protein GY744_00400 [Gammaproteobacteria bacterium]|nr:hypothetical protein [Gammaproteobacteria bacterium]
MHSGHNMHYLETSKNSLIREIFPSISEAKQEWLQKALQTISTSDQISEDLGLYSAMAKRKLGPALLTHSAGIDNEFSTINLQRWSIADAGRLILLITAIQHAPEQSQSIIVNYYKMGDESEHIALIQGLIIFAPADFLTELALDVGRSNNLEVLAALILDNPYPACFYNEQEFNQMVLKALFLGLSIERIEGIQQRANADLTRMGENYVVEREQANRSVPVDIWLAIGPFASDTGKQQLLKYISHEEVGHRYYCALALVQHLSQDPSVTAALKQRQNVEQHLMILNILQDTLQA